MIPEIVIPAVDVALLLEAARLVLQLRPALYTLKTAAVPLPFNCAQVELVHDPAQVCGQNLTRITNANGIKTSKSSVMV